MDAIPPVVSGSEVDPTGSYRCPLCNAQTTGDDVDSGWVRCPLVGEQMVCLGSCLDLQAAARSSEFETHPDRATFRNLARERRKAETDLRLICLRHQADIVENQLRLRMEDPLDLITLKGKIHRALTQATIA